MEKEIRYRVRVSSCQHPLRSIVEYLTKEEINSYRLAGYLVTQE